MEDWPDALSAFFQRDDDPKDQVGYHTREPAWQSQNEKDQPEPEGIQSKELAESAANSSDPAAMARTSQFLVHCRSVPPLRVIRFPLRTASPEVAANSLLSALVLTRRERAQPDEKRNACRCRSAVHSVLGSGAHREPGSGEPGSVVQSSVLSTSQLAAPHPSSPSGVRTCHQV